MKIILAGGSGQVGSLLEKSLSQQGHEVWILSRKNTDQARHLVWNAKSLGNWAKEFEGADIVFNLTGRTVNCRYTKKNLDEMLRSRVDSTRVVGEAISQCKNPPKLWLQMSTATLYAHTYGASQDEEHGVIGGSEADVPAYWKTSIDIGQAWEATFFAAATPHTRKIALRSAMVMNPGAGGVFDVLLRMVRFGLGGAIKGGKQFISWIHGKDFVRAVEYVIAHEELNGVINFCAPNPLPQKTFMQILRKKWGISLGLPAAGWMAELGAFFLRTDTELLFKSRKVIPGRLLKSGFRFEYPTWESAAAELVQHYAN